LAFGLWGAIARSAFAAALHSETGAHVAVEHVHVTGLHSFVATNVELRSKNGRSTLIVKRAVVSFGRTLVADLLQPHAVIARDDFQEVGTALARLDKRGVRLRIAGGSIEVGPARIDSIDGWVKGSGSQLAYQLAAKVVDATGTYPIRGRSDEDGGETVHTWNAAALPLGTLVSLAAPVELAIHSASGNLSNVELSARSAPGKPLDLRATAQLSEGTIALGDPTHTLAKLHGKLVVNADGGGSRLVEGTIDGVPIELAGLLYDDDVERFEQLLLEVAAEPNLHDARIEATAPGIAFAKYHLQSPDGKLAIFVSSVDTKNPTVSLNAVLSDNHVTSGGERTLTMGQRTGAVLGIDGDYFDIGQSYAPQGVLIISGKLLRSPTKRYAMTIHRGNHVTFDEYAFAGTAVDGSRTIPIHDFNVFPPGKIGIVTPDFGKLMPHPGIVFAALSPLDGTKAGENGRYTVTRVGPIESTEPAEMGLAFGRWAAAPPPHVGDTIELHYALSPNYDDIVAAEGGGPLMIRDGHWVEDPDAPAPGEHDVRWPVVGVGRLSDDTLLFFEVDGRWPDISIGMTRPEFGQLMLRYHVVDGFAMDSGGSADIVSRAPGDKLVSLRSHPSDQSWERYVTDAMFVYSSAPNVDP
jgi:hypothetical protein